MVGLFGKGMAGMRPGRNRQPVTSEKHRASVVIPKPCEIVKSSTRPRLVPVVIRLVGTFGWYAQIIGLGVGQSREFDPQLAKVQSSHFLIQGFR